MSEIKRQTGVVGIFLTAFVVSAVGEMAPPKTPDWPHRRGPHYNGISYETGWNTNWSDAGPPVLWQKNIGLGVSSFTISENRLYTMGNIDDHDMVYCLEAETGREIWKHSYPCPGFGKAYEGGPNATPTVGAQKVYTLSKQGEVFCLDKTTGTVIWHKNLQEEMKVKPGEWGFSGSPLVMEELVIFNVGSCGVALNQRNGEIVWENGNGPASYSSPIPFRKDDQNYIVLMDTTSAVALIASTGKERWRIPWHAYDMNVADAIITENQLFVCTGYGKGCALYNLNQEPPAEIWRNRKLRNQFSSSIIWKGHVYGFDGNLGESGATWTAGQISLRCLELGNGTLKWEQKELGVGSLMMADNKLIILTVDGQLVIVATNPDQYEEVARAKILRERCWTVPVLFQRKIYARNGHGDVVCLDVSN